MNVVSVKHITKSYAKHKALDDISFEVGEGEIFGIIGPDGAGKTTLFRILTTLLLPDSGEVSVVDLDIIKDFREIRNHVGYMPGRFSLYQDLTVEENLTFFATVFNTTIEENYHLIKEIYEQIEPFKDRRAGALSGGMKQKLALSCALIHKPSVLFLDEPTTGVDPVSRKEFWDMLKRLQKQGIAILVSTPYMDEATLCDRIALMTDGKILKIDSPANIIKQFDNILWAVQSTDMHSLLNDVRSNKNVLSCFAFGENLHVTIANENYTMDELAQFLTEKGHKEIHIESITATIEDFFMDLGNDIMKTAEV
ncbi:ABC transporter ATP-binding protein [Flavobacterium sp. HJJ]|uniref:ABC transporter ATP-binding protein n=1 Tax=Flavobacterium sp. HJJ TaxID=2783792 RepID=UPI00188D4F6A|nr:ABC transporter ATP-binding protein [Flavobacterium sp. HJJ]MBF4472645.1 ABC transporter ATP-binding protein [Flavobacterium sp. HJJ]